MSSLSQFKPANFLNSIIQTTGGVVKKQISVTESLQHDKCLINKSTADSIINEHINDTAVHINEDNLNTLNKITATVNNISNISSCTGNVQDKIDEKIDNYTDNVVSNLTINYSPSTGLGLVNKKYVDDSVFNLINKEPIGSIEVYPTTSVIPNFLKCDGSYVKKTDYANLYSKIGDNYSSDVKYVTPTTAVEYGVAGGGVPWYNCNNYLKSEDIDYFKVYNKRLPKAIEYPNLFCTKGFICDNICELYAAAQSFLIAYFFYRKPSKNIIAHSRKIFIRL